MRLYELIIEDEASDEVFQISLVENPAIEAFGVFFNKEKIQFAEMNEEGLFMAPILIPEKKILRVDGAGVPYEVYFTAQTIKRLSQMYLERKYQSNVNIEHKDSVNGVTLVETWIKESNVSDKSKLYGLNVPVGSWIGTFKIDNEEVREKFRTGELKAVSIEGLFEHLEKTPENRKENALLMESFADYILQKDVEELSEKEAEFVLSKIQSLFAQPSIPASTYPGEAAESGSYISPALFAEPKLDIFGYITKDFDICPGAVGTFNHLVNEMDIQEDDLRDMIKASAVIADMVFRIEKDVLNSGSATQEDVIRATELVKMMKDVFQTVNERTGMNHDISYMDGHIEVIKSYL